MDLETKVHLKNNHPSAWGKVIYVKPRERVVVEWQDGTFTVELTSNLKEYW